MVSGFYTSCLEVARSLIDFDMYTAWSFLENKGGTVVDHRDDMETPIREIRRCRIRGAHYDMYTDGEHHHDMYVGVEFKFEGLHLLPSF